MLKHTKDIEYAELLKDDVLKKAIIRSLEVIGEAAKNVSTEYKKDSERIPWKKIAGLRDKLIHHYFGVDWEVVWDILRNSIPRLDEDLRKSNEK